MDRLDGRGIAITGGAGDIGAAMGAELTRLGATVTLIDRKTPAEAEPWLARAREHGDVAYVQADVRDREAIDEALAAIDRSTSRSATRRSATAFRSWRSPREQWQEHLDVNLTGCFNLASRGPVDGRARSTPGASSSRQLGAGGSLAGDRRLLGDQSRRAHAGAVDGPRAGSLQDPGQRHRPRHRQRRAGGHQLETEPQYARRVRHVIPLGEPQTTAQVARATAFLCSDAADSMTGSVSWSTAAVRYSSSRRKMTEPLSKSPRTTINNE